MGSFRLTGAIAICPTALQLPRLGRLRLKERAYLPLSGIKVLSATVTEQAGHGYVSIQVEYVSIQVEYVSIQVEQEQTVPVNNGPTVGVDRGVKTLATLSDGTVLPNHRHRKRRLKKLKRLQRAATGCNGR